MLSWILFRGEDLDQIFIMFSKLFLVKNWLFLTLKENIYIIAFLIFAIYLIFPYLYQKFYSLKKSSNIFDRLLYLGSITLLWFCSLIFLGDINTFIYFQF